MRVKLVEKKCSWCKIEFQGRSYQEFCGVSCSDKSYYWHKKRGIKRSIPEIKCDVCGVFFQPIRNNTKRCSNVCRSRWVREFSHDRYRAITQKRLDQAKTVNCAVCLKEFKLTASRKTCSKKCSKIYSSYSAKKRIKRLHNYDYLQGKPYQQVLIPLPEHKPIPVGKIDLNSSKDLVSAVTSFLKGGGEIRKYKASVVTDLLDDHPLRFDEVNTDEVKDQISGTIRVK